ncbi:DUF2842 domain-containing protein [uncultured Devosia sp.]|uniref:DUF2842 domain-containing protein n=1 Tax=uncultured Devosia sp. TaxID=211434 RepID=UPI0035C9E175
MMTQRKRKFLGVLLILGSIVAWLAIGTTIYLEWFQGMAWFVLIVFFAVVGMGWIYPAMAIIRWMAKDDVPRA